MHISQGENLWSKAHLEESASGSTEYIKPYIDPVWKYLVVDLDKVLYKQ